MDAIESLWFQAFLHDLKAEAWPLARDRAQRFAEKATREARLRTSWRRPDPAYEAARQGWIAAVYAVAGCVSEVRLTEGSSGESCNMRSRVDASSPGTPSARANPSGTTRSAGLSSWIEDLPSPRR